MEFTRRTTGWFMPILITLSLSYILFLGRYIGGVLAFPGLSLERSCTGVTSPGLFGLTANISSTFVFMFIIFGAFVEVWRRGFHCAPCELPDADSSVVPVSLGGGSGLMGSCDRLCGCQYRLDRCDHHSNDENRHPQFAAGVEAAASTGALMLLVMGAGAFVLASYTQTYPR